MTRLKCMTVAGLVLLGAGAGFAQKPNILLIVVDDLGYAELGCHGNTDIPTPHIDSIARNGVRFTHAYVTAPVCSPSRAGLMTGRYQTRFGHELNVTGKQNLEEHIGLPLSERTLAGELKSAGYVTGLVGKWHLGATPKFHPQQRGFDEFFGFLHEGHFYVPPPYNGVTSFLRTNHVSPGFGGRDVIDNVIWSAHLPQNEPPYDENNPILRGRTPVVEREHLTDAFTREAIAFLDRHQGGPFFLFLSYNAPHSPMQAREKHMRRFTRSVDDHRQVFAAMVNHLDESIGAVLKKLRESGLDENTLIFFLSDNGGPTRELTSSNHPFRGEKGQLWEGGIRVPFFVQWKGHWPAEKIYSQPVISLDVFATALAAAGVRAGDAGMDGVDLAPHVTGAKREPPHEKLFWRFGPNMALRRGEWKLVKQIERGAREAGFQLFEVGTDAGEAINLFEERPELARQLQTEMDAMNREMIEPLWQRAGRRN